MASSIPPLTPSSLPPEILGMILQYALPSHIIDFKTYPGNRCSLCLVCRLWNAVLRSTPCAWSCIPVTLNTNTQFVRFCITQAKTIPISLYLYLNPLAAPDRRIPQPTPQPETVAGLVFALLRQLSATLGALNIVCSKGRAFMSIARSLSCVDRRHLVDLSLVFPSPFDPVRLRQPTETLPLFSDSSSSVVALELCRCPPPLDTHAIFVNLAVLRLTYFNGRQFRLSWSRLSDVLSTTHRLTLLQLDHVECHDLSQPNFPVPTLAYLTDLILSFSTTPAAVVASRIHMPAVTGLCLDIVDASEIVAFGTLTEWFTNRCSHILRRITVADICVRDTSSSDTKNLLLAMPALQKLDLGRSQQYLKDALSCILDDHRFSWPRLGTIRLGFGLATADIRGLLHIQYQQRLASGCVLVSPSSSESSTGFKWQRSSLIGGTLDSGDLTTDLKFGPW
ncbi:hypothetical protein B0H17DRAFT_1123947 [Mycena rosella]|uniref:F-box domain-containing protein n=1 Tax=Mycena rosella TaxID=1033263 RepID=A0AAD7H3C1_MYCRO|nr:hypothetical protein B0H17DRAFT_1123947 [Mycena rosella]